MNLIEPFGSTSTYRNGPDKGNISLPCAFFRDEKVPCCREYLWG